MTVGMTFFMNALNPASYNVQTAKVGISNNPIFSFIKADVNMIITRKTVFLSTRHMNPEIIIRCSRNPT